MSFLNGKSILSKKFEISMPYREIKFFKLPSVENTRHVIRESQEDKF